MTCKEVFDKHSEELVKCLPMNDTLFITKLSTYKLIPGDTSDQLKALPTRAAKASYFLDNVVKPALDISDTSSFENLLSAMEQCGYDHVITIACKIKSQMSNIESGMYIYIYIYVYICMYKL